MHLHFGAKLEEEFDFVIIGGGSAGCVLASRLSEDGCNSVLLLEAGGNNHSLLVTMPAGTAKILPKANNHNWGFQTTEQENLNNRKMYWPRGKGLGGSSAINAMIYTRGSPLDYDEWAAFGLKKWSYQNVLPYFKRAEGFEGGENEFHGASGPLKVSIPKCQHRGFQDFLLACEEAGHKRNSDFNGSTNEGYGLYQLTIADGKRCSAYEAYLRPNLARANLCIRTNRTVGKILFNGKKAFGVSHFDRFGSDKKTVKARREIILCGGAIASPQILLLSGIGPAFELRDLGIKVLHDSPSVGKNLMDHLDIILYQETALPITYHSLARGIKEITLGLDYLLFNKGFARENFLEVGGFAKTDENLYRPNIQFHLLNGIFKKHNQVIVPKNGFSLHACDLYPESRGEITLKSNNPMISPRIDPNYLATERDIRVMRQGFKMARNIFAQAAFSYTKELEPGIDVKSDDEIDAFIRQNAETIYHPVGTCRMGIDEESVVDETLKVRGVTGLRVVDASVMPRMIGGNTNSPTIMIAEYSSDMILGRV